MAAHDAVEVITAKRDSHALTDSQIDWVVDAYTRGEVADEQMSALAMAILLNGMDRREIARWTQAMIASGERMDFSSLSRPTADKHSTGGVGDKITLPLAPLVAACGVAVPQLSGRGLGHTGGTLDKLESIAGWQAALSNEAMLAQLEDVGAVICAAGTGLAPADKKLYALRDVTGTVEAIPLIASSIMSKKIAEGTGALVLDVKVGTGAFMKDLDRARELASTMVALGHRRRRAHRRAAHRHVHPAGPHRRQRPGGARVGGGARGRRARRRRRAHPRPGPRDARRCRPRRDDPAEVLASGAAMDAWRRMISRPGRRPGRPAARGPRDPRGDRAVDRCADPAGRDGGRDGRLAARRRPGEAGRRVQAGAGVEWHARPGDPVTEGEPLLTLHTDEPDRFDRALESLEGGYDVAPAGTAYEPRPIVLDRVGSDEFQYVLGILPLHRKFPVYDGEFTIRTGNSPPVSRQQEDHGLGDAGRLVLALDPTTYFRVSCLPAGMSVTSPTETVARTREPTRTGLGKRTLFTP